ncbi:MAG: helix-turn-helix domain-containing protein [Microscillaceae bacterium]
MEYLLAIGAVQSLFLALLILGKKPITKDDGVMLAALLLWSLRFASLWLVLQGWNKLLLLALVLFLADGPLVLLYVHCFTIERQVHYRNYTPHFIPLMLALVYFVMLPLPKGSLALLFFQELPPVVVLPFQEQLLLLSLIVSLGVYAALGFWRLGVYQRRIRENYSYTEKINLHWLQLLLGVWGLFLVGPMLFFLLNFVFRWLSPNLIANPMLGAFLVLLFVPGYFALRPLWPKLPNEEALHNLADISESDTNESGPSYQKSGLKEEQAEKYAQKLRAYMQAAQPYLDAELSLSTLAESLGLSANHLSQVINGQFGQNFFDFVNQYRVEEVKKRLQDPTQAHFTLLAIAESCGFKSKSSFNSAFKRFTGQTPSAYKNALSSPV